MEREELLEKVTAELGESQLTLSERTISEEIDDALEDFGEDEEANAKLVTKVANRLRRMDGNLHADVSKQVDAYKADYRKKLRAKQQTPKVKPQPESEEEDGLRELKEEVARLRAESETRRKSEARDAVLKDVRRSLEEKFQSAGIEVNQYFMRGAMRKLEIPDEGADREKLAAEAEKIYNGDMKEAGVEPSQKPRYGGYGGGTSAAADYFARKAKKEGWGKKR